MTDQKKFLNKLQGARVLITGGSSGIGFGVAEACVEYGVSKLYISSSSAEKVSDAVQRLQKAYPSKADAIQGVPCNLADQKKAEANIEKLIRQVGKLDHIVHTAGDPLALKGLTEATLEFMQQAGMVRFFAPLLIAKQAKLQGTFEPLDAKKSFTITSGAIREKPRPDWTVVASYAGGHGAMVQSLALDLQPVRVNGISPGGVETEMWDRMGAEQKKNLMDGMAKMTTVGKVGQVADVAEAYLYLMKDANVCGAFISTNGGAMLL